MDSPSSSYPFFQNRRFATTSWSRIFQAANSGTESSREALEQLCTLYWYPLYAFVRRKGYSKSESEDLTQAFFAHLLEKNRLELGDRSRGRFRSFLMTSITNFINQQWRAASAQKRGGAFKRLDIDFETADQRFQLVANHDLTPEKLFERQWALTVLEQALELLEQDYRESGKQDLFEKLSPKLSMADSLPYAQLAEQLNMSEPAIKVAIHRMRNRYRDKLRQIIAQTVAESPDEVDNELRHLLDVFT